MHGVGQNPPSLTIHWTGAEMNGQFDLILLAIVGFGLAAAFVHILLRMSGDQDREARRAEKDLIPHSDVTITHYGNN